jgi:hypothetical protein
MSCCLLQIILASEPRQQAMDYSAERNIRSRLDYRVVYIDILICHFLLPGKEIKIFCLLYLVLRNTARKRERSSCFVRPLREPCSPDTIYSDDPRSDYNINHWIETQREGKLA